MRCRPAPESHLFQIHISVLCRNLTFTNIIAISSPDQICRQMARKQLIMEIHADQITHRVCPYWLYTDKPISASKVKRQSMM